MTRLRYALVFVSDMEVKRQRAVAEEEARQRAVAEEEARQRAQQGPGEGKD